ncbi:unnamed protein product [Paramecium octaurelia]|uniref:Uncharacterized protein n=1 Tax=Paramecium octaurelia TaxID=43137 RepID=A0A8S1YQJ2_PAROT|nr:unnamed protein product [Paramecium octaurelia]
MQSKDSLFSKGIENKFEHLKQHIQLDIQESLNSLQDENNMQVITLLLQQIQKCTKGNQEQLIVKQELEEILNYSRQIYCQKGLFNQKIQKFQEHLAKINNMKNIMKQIPGLQNPTSLQQWLQDYSDQFYQDFTQMKKFCKIKNLEKKLHTLYLDYENFQNKNIDQLKEFGKEIQLTIKMQGDGNQFFNNKLIEEQNKYENQSKEEQIKIRTKFKYQLKKIYQKDSIIHQVTKELDLRIQMFKPKTQIVKRGFLVQNIFCLQEKFKKTITASNEINWIATQLIILEYMQ